MGRRQSNTAQLAIIGGGPAGMMAALAAAQAGIAPLLLERGPRLGRKLAISGQGRCNLTNKVDLAGFLAAFGPSGAFLRNAFHRYFVDDLCAFFERRGVALEVERGGRVFPRAQSAEVVVAALAAALEEGGVEVHVRARVLALEAERGGDWMLTVGTASAGARPLRAGAVIVATGGVSYPQTGSMGDGYGWARDVGHRLVPPRPALVPVVTAERMPPPCRQLNLRNVRLRLMINGRVTAEPFGELFFTRDGLGGPIVLSLSRAIGVALEAGARVELALDFKPALDDRQLDARLRRELDRHGGAGAPRRVLATLVPRALVEPLLRQWGVDPARRGAEVTRAERERLAALLRGLRFKVTGLRPIEEAIVTAGGVACDEIDPRTMASRRAPGLYFAGEVIDIDAETGGFNLQAAFTTGWVAGQAAAEALGARNRGREGDDRGAQ